MTILCGDNRDIWQDNLEEVQAFLNKTFKQAIKDFIGHFLSKGDIKIQQEYFLIKCFKGCSQTVEDVDQRI